MNLKTYRASSIADALGEIKRDLGPDAVILHTRTYKRGGVLGFGAKRAVEITASSSVNVMHPLARKGKAPSQQRSLSQETRPPANGRERGGYRMANVPAARAPSRRETDSTALRGFSLPTERVAPDFTAISAEASLAAAEAAADRNTQAVATQLRRTAVPTPLVPSQVEAKSQPVVSQPDNNIAAPIEKELASIKRMVGRVLQQSQPFSGASGASGRVFGVSGGSGGNVGGMPDALFQRYLQLIESELAGDLADEVIGAVRDDLNREELANEDVVHAAVLRRLQEHIPVAGSPPAIGKDKDGRPATIALVGPTGVGKTTTIAKLAATYKLKHGKRVGLITCDTYRIAAVDQLRTYANIIGLPLKVVMTPKEMATACESLRDMDIVLIDTAGRSPHDDAKLDELQLFLEAASPHETHLVLAGCASESVMVRAAERFEKASPNRVIFTKLDEAVSFGVLVNAARKIGAGLSFVTTGQEVPDHIEPGRADRLARLVLEGGSPR